jgi:hypothetical protein
MLGGQRYLCASVVGSRFSHDGAWLSDEISDEQQLTTDSVRPTDASFSESQWPTPIVTNNNIPTGVPDAMCMVPPSAVT